MRRTMTLLRVLQLLSAIGLFTAGTDGTRATPGD